MKRIISLIVVMAMMLASVLAIIPVSATASTEGSGTTAEGETSSGTTAEEETVETFRLLPDAAYRRLKAEFEADGANTPAYEPTVTPFAPTNDALQAIIGGNRIHSITLPIKNVKEADENGNINFTIKVFKYDDLVGATREPISTHVISVKPDDVGLTAPSTDVHKFVEFELETPIVVQEDEIIALMASGDQIVPAWADGSATGINTVIDEEFPAMRWFCANIGTENSASGNFNSVIFYDLELEPLEDSAPVGTAVKTESDLAAMDIGGSYYLAVDNLTLSAEWASKNLKNVTFDGNGKTITLSGNNGLFGDVANSTIKNLTLAGDVTAISGVAKTVGNVTYKNVVVSLTAVNGGSASTGALAMYANDNVTAIECTNNANVTGGEAGGVVGKISKTGASLTVEKFTNNGAITGNNTAGAITGGTEGNITTVVEDSVNTGTIKANYVGGFIGAAFAGTTKLENCVNGVADDATKGKIVAKEGAAQGQGGLVGNANKPLTVIGGANYADIDAIHVAGVVGCFEGGTLDVDGFTNYGNLKGGTTAAGVTAYVRGSAGAVTIKNSTNLGTIDAPWAGGFIAASHQNTVYLENCVNGKEGFADLGTVKGGASGGAGGFVGQTYYATTFKNCKNYATIDAKYAVGGFVGTATRADAVITISDSANYGKLVGDNRTYGGGIVAYFAGNKFTATNVTTDYAHEVNGAWNYCGGGFIGTLASDNAECYFTDCVNNTDFTKGGNPGGFIGGTVTSTGGMWNAKSVSFVRCTNNGDLTIGGCIGGFIGQAHIRSYTFIDCVNNGNITSYENVASGFVGYGWNGPTMLYRNCVNNGNISAEKTTDGKWAAGFTAIGGSKISAENCANYGDITSKAAGGTASGLFHVPASGSIVINSFNAGILSAANKYEFGKEITLDGCIETGLHEDLIEQAKELPTYAELVEKDEWQAVVDAFAAAKAVYDDAEATTVDKKAALDLVKEAIADTNTYVLVDRYAVKVSDPRLTVSYSLPGAKRTDYVALVKNGATEATLNILLEDIGKVDSFDLFENLPDGTAITEGEYTLYLVSKDVALADVIADPDKAYDAVEILIAVNVIYTAEEFMAIAGTDDDYILANDIAVEGGITFAGSLNGLGNTITLTGNKGLFRHLNGANGTAHQTIKNLKLEHTSTTSTTLSYGLIYTHSCSVTVENVQIGAMTIVNGDRAGAIIATVDDNLFNDGTVKVDNKQIDIVIKDVTSYATVDAQWCGGGLIGRALVRSIEIDNVVVSGSFVDASVNNSSGDFGAGGLLGYVVVYANEGDAYGLKITNATNNAKVTTQGTKGGGIIGDFSGDLYIENVVNKGDLVGTPGNWAFGEGGIIGYVRKSGKIYIKNAENYGSFTLDSNTNKGGIIGMVADDAECDIDIIDCENHGKISGEKNNNVGGFIGQATNNKSDIYLKNCVNYGEIDCADNAANVGGIIGGACGTVVLEDVKNLANIKGNNNTSGIIATVNGTVELKNVENVADITGKKFVGGIIGYRSVGNLTMTNVTNGSADKKTTVKGLNTTDSWKTNGVGGILGYAHGTISLTNVYNYANVSVDGERGTSIGGFAGQLGNDGEFSFTATDCVNYGTVTGYGNQVSGFVGHVKWIPNCSLTFTNCDNRGNINSVHGSSAGGFIGCAEANSGNQTYTFTNCDNYGNIVADEGGNLGGFIGYAQNAEIVATDVNNYGDITANGNAGGFIGQPNNGTYTITNFVNEGNVVSGSNYAGGFNGWGAATINLTNAVNWGNIQAAEAGKKAAGLVSSGTSTLTDCKNNGDVIANGPAAGLVVEGTTTVTASENSGTIISSTADAWGAYNGAPEALNKGKVLPSFNPEDEATFVEIWTAEEFMNMKEGFSYILMDDIVLPADYESISIGFNLYTTILDGNGKTIYMKGLSCPLFSTLKSVTIKDLTLVGTLDGARAAIAEMIADEVLVNTTYNVNIDNVTVDVDIKNTSGKSVGGFIAESGNIGTKVTTLRIANSKFLGSIDSTGYAAGFVGYFCTTGNVTFDDCTVGDVALNTHINGTGRVAGFVARLISPAANDPKTVIATFKNSTNYATISQVSTGAEGVAGGIIGRAQHISVVLDHVENYGDVSTIRPALSWCQGTGGLVGEINSNAFLTIYSSTNYGDITTDKGQIGGLVGLVSNKSFLTIGTFTPEGYVDYGVLSRNYGSVTVGATGNAYIGGLVGCAAYNDVDASLSGQNLGTANSVKVYGAENYGDVYGEWWANLGGIMGGCNNAVSDLIVIGATNWGDIESTESNVGGILGQPGASTELTVKDCTNYGNIKNYAKNGAAGIISNIWSGTPENLNIINNTNYGTIESSSAAAGITMHTLSTSAAIVSGNENYGTIISNNGNGAGIALAINGDGVPTFKDNLSSGLLIGAEKLYKTADDKAIVSGNREYCAVVTDPALVELAKKICAADYDFEDFIGESLDGAVNVDLASQIYVAQNGTDAASDFEFFYELDLDAENNTLGAKVYSDKNTAVPAMTYAAKLASISTTSYYWVTLDAKNNTNGTDSGFVYAIAPDGTVYSCVGDLDQYVAEGEEYGSYVIEYSGLNVIVLAKDTVNNIYRSLAEFEVAEGSFVAIGIANGASDYTYNEETGDVVANPAENQNTATIANVTFATSYYAGGIVSAFRALDTIDQNLANAEALAKTLEAVLAKAQEECDAAAKTEENSALDVEKKAQALADATKEGKKDEELDPYEEELAAAVAVYERAHRDHEYRKFALATAKANYGAAKADYDALKDSYKTDIANAKDNVEVEIEAALNWAGYYEAVIAALALGNKFVDTRYDVAAYWAADNRACAATNQADLDAAVADMNNVVRAVDTTTYEYWLAIAKSLKENDWTILTWKAFQEFLASLDEADKSTQEKVDALTQQIIDEIEKLKYDLYLADEMQEYFDNECEVRGWIPRNYTPRSWKPFYSAVIKPFQDAIDANKDATGSDVEVTEQVLRAAYARFNDETEATYTDLVDIRELCDILDLAKIITGETATTEKVSFSEISELYLLLAIPSAKIAYEDAVNEETTNEVAKQIVADALAAIKPAYEGLVDVADLEDVLAEYEAEVEGKSYTVASWNAYALAVSKAEFAIVAAKTSADVDAALAALTAAYENLVALGEIDIAALDEALKAAASRNEADYTRESWSALEDAVIEAKIAKYSDDKTIVENAYKALNAALNALVLMPETDSLESLIAEVETLKADDYTAKTWLVLVTALQDAKAALSSESQKTVNDATDALAAAKAELVKKQAVDTTAITALIAEIEALKADDYTSESWANLKTALDAAKAALTSDEQTVVDVAKAALDAAKANLDKVVVAVENTKKDEEEEDDTAPVQTTTDTEKKGCGSAIGATVVVMTAVLGLGATVVLKKKED